MGAEEVWISPPGYEGLYKVSNLGNVLRGGNLIQPCKTGDYWVVSLSRGGVTRTWRLHVLVLTAFCGPAPFDGAQAAHNNGDSDNNRLTNLRWATGTENQADRIRHGTMCRGTDVFGAVLDEAAVRTIRQRIRDGERNPTIANDFGVSVSTIHLIRHNKTWRHVA